MPKKMYASACVICGQIYTADNPDEVQMKVAECESLETRDPKWQESQVILEKPSVKIKQVFWQKTFRVETNKYIHMPWYTVSVDEGEDSPPLPASSVKFILSSLSK